MRVDELRLIDRAADYAPYGEISRDIEGYLFVLTDGIKAVINRINHSGPDRRMKHSHLRV